MATGRTTSAARRLALVCGLAAGMAGVCGYVVARARRARATRASRGTPASGGLQHLTDRELFAAWDHTSARLSGASSPSGATALAITMQHLYDEIRARYPRS